MSRVTSRFAWPLALALAMAAAPEAQVAPPPPPEAEPGVAPADSAADPAPPPADPAPPIEPFDDILGERYAPPADASTEGLPLADSAAPRPAPEAVLSRYRADPDFQYDRPAAERPSLWRRFLRWLDREILDPLFTATRSDGGEVIVLFLVIALLGWGVTRLLRADVGPLFGRKDEAVEAASGELLDVDDISTVDLGSMLARALEDGRLRDAVRFRYLLALQALDGAGAIAWRRDKTNRDYVREARAASGDLARPFADVTRAFDYVWYGERPVDRARFDRLGDRFDRLDAALREARPRATRRQRPTARRQETRREPQET